MSGLWRHAGCAGEAAGMRPELAVVVTTRGRPHLLERCLDSLLRQTMDPERYEIIVVDDGPDDRTRAVVAIHSARAGGAPAVRYVVNDGRRGPCAARDCGWRATAAPLVAFTNDDTVPEPRWLIEGERAIGTGKLVAANAFVRRSALERLGGFDERQREDDGLPFQRSQGA